METSKTKIEDRKSRLFYANLLGIKTEYYNPNPCQEGNEDDEDRLDCIIRAICKLLNRSWRDVYEDMSILGQSVGMMIDSKVFIELYLAKCGYINIGEIIEHDDIVTVGEFMYNYKTGRYIISSLPHAAAYIDGVWYDNYNMLSAPNHYFLVDEHCAIYVSLQDIQFKNKIDERLKNLKESSEKEVKNAKLDKMILKELDKHNITYISLPKIGNVYKSNFSKFNDGSNMYYLVSSFNRDFGVYDILLCREGDEGFYTIRSSNGKDYSLVIGKPIMMTSNIIEYNYLLVDSIPENERVSLYKYLEDVINRKEG